MAPTRRQAGPERRRLHPARGRPRRHRPQPALVHPGLQGGGAGHDGAEARLGRQLRQHRRARRATPSGAIYATAKAAVHEYTRCLAAQLRPYNIPVNCIAPGGTVTPRFLATRQADPRAPGGDRHAGAVRRPDRDGAGGGVPGLGPGAVHQRPDHSGGRRRRSSGRPDGAERPVGVAMPQDASRISSAVNVTSGNASGLMLSPRARVVTLA